MRIGILQTGIAAPDMAHIFGDYPDMFMSLLQGHGLTFKVWRAVEGELPSTPHERDGWIISGSRHGVYENLPWIKPLEAFVRDTASARVPSVGICFGHQIIAQALGGRVEKYDKGWAVGATQYDFEGRKVTLNAWHQDQVITPPKEAKVIGSNPFCANAALLYGDYAFSVQAHPEFGAEFIAALIEKRGKGVVPDSLLNRARQNLERPVDAHFLAEKIVSFFKAPRE